MFLKRLDIIGFKSFADKTGIEFAPGITAVVGPNGSGKSNISDAVRWVLGEQSARSLRGAKMEDVIFAGSDSRRSINYCEVSLTLDNSDGYLPIVFDEVTIARRVYRSGESEYRLNKKVCRLKDITEVFMDSGLGRESYSIIGQGRIEEMLSTKPEERRGPFEDAAGIVKFKFRKREAQRKLEETDANILRVDDILSELGRQAGPLEQEAQRASQYKEIRGQLTELDISLLVHDIEQLQSRFKDAGEQIGEWNRRRDEAVTDLAELEQSAALSRSTLNEQLQAAENLQQQLMDSVEARQRYQGQQELLSERRKNAEAGLAERRRQQHALAEEGADLDQRIQTELERYNKLSASVEVKNGELEVAVEAVDPVARSVLESEIDGLNSELIELHHDAATARNEMKQAESAAGDDERRRTRLREELEQRNRDADSLAQEVVSLETEQDTGAKALSELANEFQTAQTEAKDVSAREAEVAKKIGQMQSQVAALQSRLELLKDLEAGYDGYAAGVRFVLQSSDKGKLQGIHGSVVSLIRVPGQYETAIETALGGALQNIVSKDEASARGAIQLLKQRQAGRATFMPLTVIRSRSLRTPELQQVQRRKGFVNLASELVQTEPVYNDIVGHLLGNVIVAETLEAANDIARTLQYRVRIVTLDGDVVNPGGTMSGGGHSRKGPGLLGRSREQSQIDDKLAGNRKQLDTFIMQQAELRNALLQLQRRQQHLDESIGERRAYLGELQAKLREVKARQHHANELYQGVLWEQQQLEAGKLQSEQRVSEAQRTLAQIENQLQNVETQLRERRSELDARDKHAASTQEHLTGLRVEVATLKQEQDGVGQRIEDYRQRQKRLAKSQQESQAEQGNLEELIQKTEFELQQIQNESQHAADSVGELEQMIAALRIKRQEAEVDLQAAEERVRQQQTVVHSTEEQVHRAKVQAERIDVELDHALERMGEQFKMTYEWAKDNYPPVTDVDSVRSQAEQLRGQMRSLGDVQLGAIEEWARLSERMTFLQSEREDLEDAKSQLEQLIAEMDEEMSKRFAATFQQIRTEFQVAFRQLFNGGRADLQLTDEADLLNTGIDVSAQPPGKKLQNLNLLSGGERALTAMALLFAILRVKPVPFCVLDEVEAALDEANVGRFAQYLRRFSDESQFIVITHRRGTMEEADVLYGVTMQESGVSSLIGVKLSDVEMETETA